MKQLIENSNLTKDNLKVLYKHCLEEALVGKWVVGKMRDFVKLSKSEFLRSYSYITEKAYDNTISLTF